MPDAYDKTNAYDKTSALGETDRCGCGTRLCGFALRVVHAETGVLLTRLCRRCAADLMAPPVPGAAARAGEAAG
jgi:hypothetical protein